MPPNQRPRLTRRQHQQLASRVTTRDLQILESVRKFRVLTVHQIALMHFDGEDSARQRLVILSRLGALDRFRPQMSLGEGTAPFHYVLGPGGAAVLAATEATARADYRRDRAFAVAFNRQLPRLVAVNDFAACLYALSRQRSASRVRQWLTADECAKAWKPHVEPHAYGDWVEGDERSDFFLEYDVGIGIKPVDELIRKLPGYRELADLTSVATPVLVLTRTSDREIELRNRLARELPHRGVPIVTGCLALLPADLGEDGPTANIWLPLGASGPRLRLARLRAALPQVHEFRKHREAEKARAGAEREEALESAHARSPAMGDIDEYAYESECETDQDWQSELEEQDSDHLRLEGRRTKGYRRAIGGVMDWLSGPGL